MFKSFNISPLSMAVLPPLEYSKKRILKEVGVNKFIKSIFYFLGPYTAYVITQGNLHSIQNLPQLDVSLFSNDSLSNVGRGLYYAGEFLWILSFAHLYGVQVGSLLFSSIKEGVKKASCTLTTHLEYSLTRHPIYLGLRTAFLGYFLEKPTLGSALACSLVFLTTELSARGEEKYLETMWGERYEEYKSKVSRWIPRPRRVMKIVRNPSMLMKRVEGDMRYTDLLNRKFEIPKSEFEEQLQQLREDEEPTSSALS